MSGSTFGNIFRISTWGESHGKALGVVIDGCPAGLLLCEEDIQRFLDRSARRAIRLRYSQVFLKEEPQERRFHLL